MPKVIIYNHKKEEAKKLLKKADFDVVESLTDIPEFVVSYGGDGTIMRAEYQYPGVPKIILQGSRICKKCSNLSNEEILQKVKKGKYKIKKHFKLQVKAKNKVLTAMDGILVHNKDPRHGIRYKVEISGKSIGHEIIGDGVVVATPFGATGYYRSITDSVFEVGIGVAFNNSTEQADHMVLREDAEIKLHITRGIAEVFADNQKEYIELDDGDEVVIKKSNEFVGLVYPVVEI